MNDLDCVLFSKELSVAPQIDWDMLVNSAGQGIAFSAIVGLGLLFQWLSK